MSPTFQSDLSRLAELEQQYAYQLFAVLAGPANFVVRRDPSGKSIGADANFAPGARDGVSDSLLGDSKASDTPSANQILAEPNAFATLLRMPVSHRGCHNNMSPRFSFKARSTPRVEQVSRLSSILGSSTHPAACAEGGSRNTRPKSSQHVTKAWRCKG